jgi:hypothetical protein
MTTRSLFDIGPEVHKSAILSPDGVYRYTLGRRWGDGAYVNFVMLNPSTADATEDDATIRRCVGFARSWGHDALVVTNLFALRSTDPKALLTHPTPIGPENDAWLGRCAREAGIVVCAWGADRAVVGRDGQVLRLLRGEGVALHHLCLTKAGHPGHPLFLPGRLTPVPWEQSS